MPPSPETGVDLARGEGAPEQHHSPSTASPASPASSADPASPASPAGPAAARELQWYVEQIVRPQLEPLLDALRTTTNLLVHNQPTGRGPPVTLALSASSGAISGVLTRDGAYVTKLQAKVAGSSVVSRLALVRPLVVAQIVGACDAIHRAGEHLLRAQRAALEARAPHTHAPHTHAALVEALRGARGALGEARAALQLPTDPALVFPQHVTSSAHFEPDFGRRLAVDVYVSQAEVCMDIKDLRAVQERPWCDMDAAGKLYVDRVRDEILAGRAPPARDDSVWARMWRRPDAADYVARCVTYDGAVVMVRHKAEVLLPDPVLYSAFTKLDTLEYVVGTFMDNMEKLM